MSECWTIRTHPRIDSISKSQGYISGGQVLDITGVGLKGTDVQVTIDGVACSVQSVTAELIRCKTGEATQVSTTGVTQPSTPGLREKIYDPEDDSEGVSHTELENASHPLISEQILTSFETIQDTLNRAGRVITGYFRAPATGNFRFKMSSDDTSRLSLDQTAYDATSPVEPTWTEIASRYWHNNWR